MENPTKIIITESGITAFFNTKNGDFQVGKGRCETEIESSGFRDAMSELNALLNKWLVDAEIQRGNKDVVTETTIEEKLQYDLDNSRGTVRERLAKVEDVIEIVKKKLGI